MHYDPRQRAAEKQASREEDEELVRSGKSTLEQVGQKNNAFRGMKIVVDLEYAKRVR